MSTKIVNGVELGPDGKEWAKTEAGDNFMCEMSAKANGFHGMSPWYYGWALRKAFVAGAEWQEQRMQTAVDHIRAAGTDYLGFAVKSVTFRERSACIVDRDFPIGTPITVARSLKDKSYIPNRLPAWVKEGAKFRLYDRRLYHVHGVVNGIAVLKEWWKHKQRWNYTCEDYIFFEVAERQKTIKIVRKAK